MATISLTINGKTYSNITVPDLNMPLLWVLRDILGLTGTKYGCGVEQCGACTVIISNQREHSCVFNVGSAVGKPILTVEGLANDPDGKKVVQAWTDNQVAQCGYCQPGMLMVTTAALKAGRHGNQIASDITHICACGTYKRINDAIQKL